MCVHLSKMVPQFQDVGSASMLAVLATICNSVNKLIHVDLHDVTHAWDDEQRCQAHGRKKYQQFFVGQTDPC